MELPKITSSVYQNQYVAGVLTSLITIVLLELRKWFLNYFVNRKFKSIFSKKSNQLTLIVPGYSVRKDFIDVATSSGLHNPNYPLYKLNDFFSVTKLISNSEVKALKYLSDNISKRLKYSPNLELDDVISPNLDLDFICFGSSNFYCKQILNDQSNSFLNFENFNTIASKVSKENYTINDTYDYGVIVKLKNYNFPDRIWISIFGIGETGTSACGWYLSKYWKEIQGKVGSNEFALIIKVQKGVDHSARIIESYYKNGSSTYKIHW